MADQSSSNPPADVDESVTNIAERIAKVELGKTRWQLDTFDNIVFSNMAALAESDVSGIVGILTNLIEDDHPKGYYEDRICHFFAHKVTDEEIARGNLVSEFFIYELPDHFCKFLC